MKRFVAILSIVLFITNPIRSQQDSHRMVHRDSLSQSNGMVAWSVEAIGAIGCPDNLPFWSNSFRRGLMTETSGGTLIAGTTVAWNTKKNFTFRAGFSGAGNLAEPKGINVSKSNVDAKLKLDRLYVGFDYWKAHLDIGMTDRHEDILTNLSVTGGNIIWTGNSRNMPGWNISTDYINIGRWFSFKVNLADYKPIDTRFVSNSLIHNQSLFVRFAILPNLKLSIGIDMWCEWAGNGKSDVTFGNYWRVLLAKQGGEDASTSDQINAIGNHLGRENLRVEWDAKKFKMVFNYDKPYEDGSGTRLQNLPDGVYSLLFSFNNRKGLVTDVLGEFVTTMWQSGPAHDRPAEPGETSPDWLPGRVVLGGNDDYFNNGEYRSGWTYYGKIIGLPLFTTVTPNADGITMGIVNNRIIGFNIGLKGMIFQKVPYAVKGTYTMNYGTYNSPFDAPKDRFSLAIEGTFQKMKWLPMDVTVGLYGDMGNLTPASFGFTLTLNYAGFYKFGK